MIKRTLTLLLLSSLATVAFADERFFTYTYDWFTPSKLEKEIELGYTGFRNGGFFGTAEFEYGVTNRWVVAPYVLFEKEGGTTKFQGVRLEQRYRFGDFGFGKIMPAAYLEVQKENDEPWELEGKLILSYMPNDNWIASTNLILEQELKSGEKSELGYSVGIARIFDKFTFGAEAFGNWKANEHFWGPSIGFRAADRMKIIATAGIPISRGGTSQFRILLGKEF